MAYFGKEFVTDKQENFAEFLDALKLEIPPEIKSKIVDSKQTVKIDKKGDEYTITTTRFDGTTSITFKIGVEYEETNFGRTAKVIASVDGDTFTQVQTYPEGVITYKRQFSANELVVTITMKGWNGEAKRYYKAK